MAYTRHVLTQQAAAYWTRPPTQASVTQAARAYCRTSWRKRLREYRADPATAPRNTGAYNIARRPQAHRFASRANQRPCLAEGNLAASGHPVLTGRELATRATTWQPQQLLHYRTRAAQTPLQDQWLEKCVEVVFRSLRHPTCSHAYTHLSPLEADSLRLQQAMDLCLHVWTRKSQRSPVRTKARVPRRPARRVRHRLRQRIAPDARLCRPARARLQPAVDNVSDSDGNASSQQHRNH